MPERSALYLIWIKYSAAILIKHAKHAARQEGIALLGIDFWSFNGRGHMGNPG